MSSMPGRVVHSWNKGSVRQLMKCMAIALHDEGLRGKELFAAFEKMLPAWKTFFDKPISDNAPGQRADKARRIKTEAPEKHRLLGPLWKGAVRDVKARKVWSRKELLLAFPDQKKKAPPAKKARKRAA